MNKDKRSIEIGFIEKGTGKHQSNTVYLGVGGTVPNHNGCNRNKIPIDGAYRGRR